MKLVRTLALVTVGLGGLSCSEATSPVRSPVYEWRLVVGVVPDTNTLSFHWPVEDLPVRIWVEDSLEMPERIREGIASWKAAFLYGEYDAVVVNDSSTADVLVRVLTAPLGAQPTIGRLPALFAGCEGATDIDTVATRFELRIPVRMYIWPKYDPMLTDLTECFRVTARHELGHSLGIFQHSLNADDIMYTYPVAGGLSDRDVNTAQTLAHWPANMIPTR